MGQVTPHGDPFSSAQHRLSARSLLHPGWIGGFVCVSGEFIDVAAVVGICWGFFFPLKREVSLFIRGKRVEARRLPWV